MPFLKRQTKKKLNPQYVEDPSARNNFEVIYDNLTEIFRRLDQRRWAVSESTGGGGLGTNIIGTTFTKPGPLKVKLNCTGKNPVLVFMRQKSEVVSLGVTTGTTGGGIRIANAVTSGGLGIFLIGNATRQTVIHGVTLGGVSDILGPPIDYEIYYPASAVLGVDTEPVVGPNEYEIFVACGGPNEVVTLQDCELFAVELF
jgi:hypothetical protein